MDLYKKQELTEKYVSYINEVVKWNSIGRLEPLDQQLLVQVKVTEEEIKETIAAITARDYVEILDGVADVLVTAGYLAYLNKPNIDILQTINEHGGSLPNTYSEIANNLKELLLQVQESPTTIEHAQVLQVIAWARECFGFDAVTNYIEAVLESNNSKFIAFEEGITDEQIVQVLEYELELATKKYAGKHKDLVFVRVPKGSVDYYVLRSDNGQGKILKPTRFKEPTDLLSITVD